MPVTRRIYVSLPADRWLSDDLNKLKWAIVDEVAKLGVPEIFTNPRGTPGLASWKAWTARDCDEVARRCIGAVLIGMPRWRFRDGEQEVRLPTEYNHYEGAVARTLGLPTLVLVEADVLRRVVFEGTFGGYVGEIPQNANESWVKEQGFTVPFGYWQALLKERRDIFLGYCSSSAATASNIRHYLQAQGATVLDWQEDFLGGRSILEQIQDAAARCSAGVFLFTRDDDLEGKKTAPRDNVVFEAGYFIAAKGKRNVLIVREKGSKMPADLGGDVYAALPKRNDIRPVERVLAAFVNSL